MDKKLVTYFVLAYGLSWLVMVPLALQGSDVVSGIPAWVHMLAAFGPLLASVGLTAWFDGKRGLKELWSRMTRWQIGGFWLWVFSPLWIMLLAGIGFFLMRGDWSVCPPLAGSVRFPD